MRADPGGPKTRKARVPKVKPRVVKPPAGDIASSGGDYGMREAKRAERSAPVKRAQRAVYDAQPVAQRQRIQANATGSVRANLKPIHESRVARNQQLAHDQAQHDVPSDADRGRASAFLLMHPEIMHPDHPHHGSVIGTIVGAAKLGQVGAKAGADLAAKVAPILAKGYMPAIAATAHFTGHDKEFNKIAANAGRDAIDIPANAAPSTYYLGKTAIHDPVKAGKMLAQPYIDFAKHPVRSLEEHPVGSALLFSGGEAAVGGTAGRIARTVPSKTLNRIASTERAAVRGPGNIRVSDVRQFNRDPIRKAGQVAADKRRAKRQNTDELVMSEDAIAKRVDESRDAAVQVTQHHQAETAKAARKAVGRKPSAAVSLAAQGITTHTAQDIAGYLEHLRAQEPKLTGSKLKANRQAQAHIVAALKNHNGPKVAAQATAYQQLAADLEAQVHARNLVDPKIAERTRLAGGQQRAKRVKVPKVVTKARAAANRGEKQARRDLDHAEARLAQATAVARDSAHTHGGVAPAAHDELLRAAHVRDQALARHQAAKHAQHAAKTQVAEAALPAGSVPAYVSHAPGGDVHPAPLPAKPPKLAHDAPRAGQAIKEGTLDLHPDRLVRQAVDTQRRVDSADAYNSFLEDFGHRPAPHAPVAEFSSSKSAVNAARKLSDDTGIPWVPMRKTSSQGGKHVLVPKAAKDRLDTHAEKIATPAAGYTRAFTRNVLVASPSWLLGQVVEPAVRAAAMHAGPGSWLTGHVALRHLTPEVREQVQARALGGGLTKQLTKRDIVDIEHLPNTRSNRMLKAMNRLGRRHGPKEVVFAVDAFSRLTMGTINHLLQAPAQKAIFGKALRDSPLMDGQTVRFTRQAAQDAADGLVNTDAQVALGRAVDRAWGRYGKMSPLERTMVGTFSPFLSWSIAATKFLTIVMPVDHPVLTSLLVSANQASEDWRRDMGIVFDPFDATDPGWLQGSIPGKNGSHLQLSRYTPFGLLSNDTGPVGAATDSILPQFSGVIAAGRGQDWKGDPLAGPHSNPTVARSAMAALSSLVKNAVPGANQAVGLLGWHTPDQADVAHPTHLTLSERAAKTFNPVRWTPGHTPKARRPRVKKKLDLVGGSGSGRIGLLNGSAGSNAPLDIGK